MGCMREGKEVRISITEPALIPESSKDGKKKAFGSSGEQDDGYVATLSLYMPGDQVVLLWLLRLGLSDASLRMGPPVLATGTKLEAKCSPKGERKGHATQQIV